MKKTFALFAALALTASAFAVEIDKPAPDFTGTDINAKTVKLSDYKGKIVVIESYNSDCPFCHNHYATGAMQELQRDLAGTHRPPPAGRLCPGHVRSGFAERCVAEGLSVDRPGAELDLRVIVRVRGGRFGDRQADRGSGQRDEDAGPGVAGWHGGQSAD